MAGQWVGAEIAKYWQTVPNFMDDCYCEALCNGTATIVESGDRVRHVSVKKGELWSWHAVDYVIKFTATEEG